MTEIKRTYEAMACLLLMAIFTLFVGLILMVPFFAYVMVTDAHDFELPAWLPTPVSPLFWVVAFGLLLVWMYRLEKQGLAAGTISRPQGYCPWCQRSDYPPGEPPDLDMDMEDHDILIAPPTRHGAKGRRPSGVPRRKVRPRRGRPQGRRPET